MLKNLNNNSESKQHIIKVIEFFAGKQLLTTTFNNNNIQCFSLDNHQVRGDAYVLSSIASYQNFFT